MSGKLTVIGLLLAAILLPVLAWFAPCLAPPRPRYVDPVKGLGRIYPGVRFPAKWLDKNSVMIEIPYPNPDEKYKRIMPITAADVILTRTPEKSVNGKADLANIKRIRNGRDFPVFHSANEVKAAITELKQLPPMSDFAYVFSDEAEDFFGATCLTPLPMKGVEPRKGFENTCYYFGQRGNVVYSILNANPAFDYEAAKRFGLMVQSKLEKMGELPVKAR